MLVWGLMVRTTIYGMELWMLSVYIVMLRIIDAFQIRVTTEAKTELLGIACPVAIMICFLLANGREFYSYAKISYVRRCQAAVAVERGLESITVPKFDESLSQERYLFSYLNEQDKYDWECYIKYYGTRLIIEE